MTHHSPQKIATVADRLQSFDWKKETGIRFKDIPVFKAAARAYDHVIIVRESNSESMRYIGENGFSSKPIDCKPKTADKTVSVEGVIPLIECAGLVVNPTLLPNAFNKDRKKLEAKKAWDDFMDGVCSRRERKNQIFRRHSMGFYAVDTNKTSKYYGCLMISESPLPAEGFSLDGSTPEWEVFKQQNMSYLYGDYDLYGLIDTENIQHKKLMSKEIKTEQLHGYTHFYSPRFKDIQEFLNAGIGVRMIQHGSEDAREHKGNNLYVFTPIGTIYSIKEKESVDNIREIYRILFKQEA